MGGTNCANKALEKAKVDKRISDLSNEARGLKTIPMIHRGHIASKLEKGGTHSDCGDIN
ncbi:MobA/MobL family protein [Priestia megaterium]